MAAIAWVKKADVCPSDLAGAGQAASKHIPQGQIRAKTSAMTGLTAIFLLWVCSWDQWGISIFDDTAALFAILTQIEIQPKNTPF